jgi:hypothetical protein
MNTIIGIVCFAIAVFLYASTLDYPYKSSIGILPGTWPRMIAYLIGIFSAILIIQSLVTKRRGSEAMRFTRETLLSAIVPAVIVASIVIYIVVWSYWRTFFLPTFILTTIIVTLLKRDKRSILDYMLCGIIGLSLTTIIYLVFYYVFRLPL